MKELNSWGFLRRWSAHHDLLNYTEAITDNPPLEDLIDSSLSANGQPQSCWLAESAPLTGLPSWPGWVFFEPFIPHTFLTHHWGTLSACVGLPGSAGRELSAPAPQWTNENGFMLESSQLKAAEEEDSHWSCLWCTVVPDTISSPRQAYVTPGTFVHEMYLCMHCKSTSVTQIQACLQWRAAHRDVLQPWEVIPQFHFQWENTGEALGMWLKVVSVKKLAGKMNVVCVVFTERVYWFSEGTGHRSDAGCKSMYACAPFNSHCSGGFTSEAAGWVPTNCKFSADETNILLFTFGFFLN